MGGSAWAMARDIGSGVLLVSVRTFRRMTREEIVKLKFELERLQRQIRGDQPPLEDQAKVRDRQQKLQRLTRSLSVLNGALQTKR